MPERVAIYSNTDEVAAKYAEYFKHNTRDINELVKKKSVSLAISLWMFTPKASPSDIKSKVQSLGWQVIRPKNEKMQELIAKFGGGMAAVRKGRRSGFKEISLEDMQRVVIGLRIRRVGGLAGGWLAAARQAGGKQKGKLGKGYVHIDRSNNVISIIVANSMPGIIALEERSGFVAKAMQREIDDMNEYIARKMKERATLFNPSGKL